jgi:hypothetical protein
MANLEDHAIQRDRRFIVRLVLGLVAGAIFGLFVFDNLTSDRTTTCAARMFGSVAPSTTSP